MTMVPVVPGDGEGSSRNIREQSTRGNLEIAPVCNEEGLQQSCKLEWHNVTYKISLKKSKKGGATEKILLNDVSGVARPSEVLSIIGASGAGKSTLLDVLAGRVQYTSITGSILLNGLPVDARFRRLSGYVMQDDALFPMLTVFETLLYSARLRIPAHFSLQDKKKQVKQLLEQLGLTAQSNTIIGDEQNRGVSGGERRRVSIGVDMIHEPPVLFLDEPTSGLDSNSALNVVQILAKLAQTRHTIVLTIHQPSARIIALLDKVICMSEGNVVYNGPPTQIGDYMGEFGTPMPAGVSPFEFLLDTLDDLKKDKGTTSSLAEFQHVKAKERKLATTSIVGQVEEVSPSKFANNPLAETFVLLDRAILNVRRTKELFFARVGLAIMAGIMLGTTFLNPGTGYEGVLMRTSYFAYTIALFIFTSTEALPLFIMERNIFIRETSRGAYRPSSYAISMALVNMPYFAFIAVLYPVISYWMVDLAPGAERFFFAAFVIWVVMLAANAFVMFMSVVVPDFIIGNSATTALFAFMFLFCGFFISQDNIPGYWIWLHYLSLFKWSLEALVVNEFEDDTSIYGCPKGANNDPNCTITPRDVLRQLDMDDTNKWLGLGVLLAMAIGWRVCFWLALCWRKSQQRK
eukprot:jgi/Mesvir1/6129/Mv00833-RA.1